MSTFSKMLVGLMAVCMIVVLVGCGTAQPTPPRKPIEELGNAPQWVTDPTGAFPGDKGKVLYAVGMCAYNPNPALTVKVARSRARVEMAATIKTHVDAMLKDWMAASVDFANPDMQTSKQFTESVSRDVTSATLEGSTEAKRWTSPQGTVYALYMLNLDGQFMKAIKAKAKAALQDQQDKLLKGKMEDALSDLDKYLAGQQK